MSSPRTRRAPPPASTATRGQAPVAVQSLLDALESPSCIVRDDGVIVAVNRGWREFARTNGGSDATTGIGVNYLRTCTDAAAGLLKAASATAGPSADDGTAVDDASDARDVAAGLRLVLDGSIEEFVHDYPCHSAKAEHWCTLRIAPVRTRLGTSALLTHTDITALRETRDALVHQALHDALTGLPNRVLLADRLAQALADGKRRGTLVGVGFLDLDHFKRVNDGLGHAIGDALLVSVAARLREHTREGDTLARYSGDEFVLVWRELEDAAAASALGERLGHALREPFHLAGTAIEIGASIGIAVGEPGQCGEDILLDADAAMYDAKRHGRGRTRTFEEGLHADARTRLATEAELRVALSHDELVLHYQPVVDLRTGVTVAVEALVRWQHPVRGVVGPDQFIGVAETSGLITPLGRWVLVQAFQDLASLSGTVAGLDIAVNLSAAQLIQPDVLGHVRMALSRSGLPPHRVTLEVTESALMADEQAAALALEELDALGVRLAIDDFGTGWSSLLYLRRHPISTVKLDRTFVSGIGRSQADEAICASVVNLAQSVGATSIAEGVETREQLAVLCELGCQQAQGYLWSPAVPIAELPATVHAIALAAAQWPFSAQRATHRRVTDHDSGHAHARPEVSRRVDVLLAAGASANTIAAALNQEKMLRPAGLRWTAAAVARHIAAS